MYSTSTQRRFWTFKCDEELDSKRRKSNLEYIHSINASSSRKGLSDFFLTADEELIIVRHYEKRLRDFLQKFMPRQEPLPRDVKGTTFQFFKRFFLVNSVMDYHPKEIMISCIFLACKVCEYPVPIDIFVNHIEGDAYLLKNIIIDQEPEVLARTNFQIHVSNPYRCIDGLIIDLKTRYKFRNPERLYEHIYRFISGMWYTDVCLLYSPPQIALAALTHACTRLKENIDDFIRYTILNCPPATTMDNVIRTVRDIRNRVMNQKPPASTEVVNQLEARLARCRNPYNDPCSEIFKIRMKERALDAYVPTS